MEPTRHHLFSYKMAQIQRIRLRNHRGWTKPFNKCRSRRDAGVGASAEGLIRLFFYFCIPLQNNGQQKQILHHFRTAKGIPQPHKSGKEKDSRNNKQDISTFLGNERTEQREQQSSHKWGSSRWRKVLEELWEVFRKVAPIATNVIPIDLLGYYDVITIFV